MKRHSYNIISSTTALMAALLLHSAAIATEQFDIDKDHSAVGFAVKHMTVSNVKGGFNDYSGVIHYDEKDISKSAVSVKIAAASIDTGNSKRDEHLRNPDFFDTAKNPEITFTSKSIRKNRDGFVAVGDLSMRGVSKSVEIPFTVSGPVTDPWGNNRIGVEGSLTINRQDWGVSWSKTMDKGGLVVGNEVKISLAVEAIKSAAKK